MSQEITAEEFTRLANNFYISQGQVGDINRIATDSYLVNYLAENQGKMKKKFKIAFCSIVLNPPYWQYAKDMIEGAKQSFLPGHDVDFFLWTDMPAVDNQAYGATVFETEPVEWPMPTLLRYHLYLQQEEKLKEYDYIFHCDVDMRFVNIVGDEILGEGLTAAPHPGYYIKKELWPPYEPNTESAAYIKRPGLLINDEGKPRFQPMYWAGGFQGGRTKEWIEAMKAIRKTVDEDFAKNYIAIWNEESHWNKYLSENPPAVMLTPSYVYPDSLIKEYYEPKVWGCSFQPKIVTLTKSFGVSAEGGQAVLKMIQ